MSVVYLHEFYSVQRQSSPNPRYCVKAPINLHSKANFQFLTMRLSSLTELLRIAFSRFINAVLQHLNS